MHDVFPLPEHPVSHDLDTVCAYCQNRTIRQLPDDQVVAEAVPNGTRLTFVPTGEDSVIGPAT